MMQMANPLWLWGLAGLLIPVAIHLLSRKEGKIVPFGSTRFLRESTTTQFRSIRFNEGWLLLLRCMMITFLVLFLGNFTLDIEPRTMKILLIDKGVSESSGIGSLRDSLVNAGYSLQSGYIGSKNIQHEPDLWSIVQYMGNKKNYDVVIITSQSMDRFVGERVALPDNMRWISIDPAEERFTSLAVEKENNTAWLRHGITNGILTQYVTEIVQNPQEVRLKKMDTIRVRIESEETFFQDKEFFIAALKTLQTVTPHVIEISEEVSATASIDPDWIFQLGLSSQKKNKNTIRFKQFSLSDLPLFIRDTTAGKNAQHWFLTRRLNTTVSLEHNLVYEVGKIILDESHSAIQTEPDHRAMPDHQLWSKRPMPDGGSYGEEEQQKSSNWLFLLFLLTFGVERILSVRKKQ